MRIAQKIELIAIVAIVAAMVMLLKGYVPWMPSTDSTTQRAVSGRPSASTAPSAVGSPDAPISADGSLGVFNMWKARFEEAQVALAQGDNKRAEASLLMALPLAPDAGPNALHETLDDLGLACYRLGEYQRSAQYQGQAVVIAGRLPMGVREATVGLYECRYAQALEALNDHDGALAALVRAEAAYRVAYPIDSAAYAEAMGGLAAQHRRLGNNPGAARISEES